MSDRHGGRARAAIADLVSTIREGGWVSAARRLDALAAGDSAPDERLRSILIGLVELTASLVHAYAAPVDDDQLFELDLRREDESIVDIDHLGPPLRATMRALLAGINGYPQDAADQVDLVLLGGRLATMESILTVLQWTTNLLDTCQRNHIATPEWLAAA